MTNNSTKLSSVYDTSDSIEVQSKWLLKELNKVLHQCFKKVQMKELTNKERKKIV